MTITILQDRTVRLSDTDTRTFVKGDTHTLIPAHEQKLIGLGVAREGGPNDDQPAAPRKSKAMNPVEENKAMNPVTETKSDDPVVETKASRKQKKAR